MNKYYFIIDDEKSKMFNSLSECSSKAWSCCNEESKRLSFYNFEQINEDYHEECGESRLIISLNEEEIKSIKFFQWISCNSKTTDEFRTWIKRGKKTGE